MGQNRRNSNIPRVTPQGQPKMKNNGQGNRQKKNQESTPRRPSPQAAQTLQSPVVNPVPATSAPVTGSTSTTTGSTLTTPSSGNQSPTGTVVPRSASDASWLNRTGERTKGLGSRIRGKLSSNGNPKSLGRTIADGTINGGKRLGKGVVKYMATGGLDRFKGPGILNKALGLGAAGYAVYNGIQGYNEGKSNEEIYGRGTTPIFGWTLPGLFARSVGYGIGESLRGGENTEEAGQNPNSPAQANNAPNPAVMTKDSTESKPNIQKIDSVSTNRVKTNNSQANKDKAPSLGFWDQSQHRKKVREAILKNGHWDEVPIKAEIRNGASVYTYKDGSLIAYNDQTGKVAILESQARKAKRSGSTTLNTSNTTSQFSASQGSASQPVSKPSNQQTASITSSPSATTANKPSSSSASLNSAPMTHQMNLEGSLGDIPTRQWDKPSADQSGSTSSREWVELPNGEVVSVSSREEYSSLADGINLVGQAEVDNGLDYVYDPKSGRYVRKKANPVISPNISLSQNPVIQQNNAIYERRMKELSNQLQAIRNAHRPDISYVQNPYFDSPSGYTETVSGQYLPNDYF